MKAFDVSDLKERIQTRNFISFIVGLIGIGIILTWMASSGVGKGHSGKLINEVLSTIMVLGVSGSLFFYQGLKEVKKYKIIQSLPTSRIRSLAIGLAEVSGRVVPFKEELMAPLSKKRCVYYKCEVYEWKSSGKSSYWKKVKEVSSHRPFYIKDDTGAVLVDPRGAEFNLPISYSYQSPFSLIPPSPPQEISELLKSLGISQGFLLFRKKFKVVEKCLPVGSSIYILGWVGDNPYKEEATAKFGYEDLMIQRRKGRPFIISAKKEREFLRRLLLRSLVFLIVGIIMLSISIYFIISSFSP
ncbi:hypothetical protein DRN63_04180 [Nanoarchaeota archaeon]|nr:MAG: hypothetical protein DRN63_04180 [Nanoarchaeota archaeon]